MTTSSAKNEPKIPSYLLVPIPQEKVYGLTKFDMLDTLLRYHSAIDLANCRLYEARVLNNPLSKETIPEHCKPNKSLD